MYGWRDVISIGDDLNTAIRLAEEALASANADSESSAYAGYTLAFTQKGVERGIRLVEDATEQCPSFAWAWASLALLEYCYLNPERAIQLGEIALRLNPRDPQSFRAGIAITGALFVLDRFEDCLIYAEQGLHKAPDVQFFIVFRIACLVQLGRIEQAREISRRLIERHPKFTIDRWSAFTRSTSDASKIEAIENALSKALPD